MLEKGRFEMVRFCAYVLYASITVLLVASHSANWIAHDCWEKMDENGSQLCRAGGSHPGGLLSFSASSH